MDIYRFFLDKLVFPKVVEFSTPGSIESRTATRFGTVKGRSRIVTLWESSMARLETTCVELLGKGATEELMYRAGKRQGVRYMLFGNKRVPPSIRGPVIEYFFNTCRAAGFRATENISYDDSSRVLRLHGKDNIVCRLSGEGAIFSGFTAGAMSIMLGEEMEADMTQCTGRGDEVCEIICFPRDDARTRIVADIDTTVGPRDTYVRDNFGRPPRITERLPTFSDLIGSGKVVRKRDTGRLFIGDEGLFQFECAGPAIILDEFRKVKKEGLLHGEIRADSERIGHKILAGREGVRERLGLLRSLLSGLAYGIPFFDRTKDGVDVSVLNPPVCRFGAPLWQVWEMEGMLSAALERPVSTGDVHFKQDRLRITYPFD